MKLTKLSATPLDVPCLDLLGLFRQQGWRFVR
jgi:hypothetical protein